MLDVRPAAVAGAFYPGRRSELERDVRALIEDARDRLPDRLADPEALILPHAGYVYSGSTAALGYAALERVRDRVHRVVLLGPTHRHYVDGLALPGVDAFETPLGRVPVEPITPAVRDGYPQLVVSPAAHALEHSLEVHLPFLQIVLEEFTVVPLAVGGATPAAVADVIDALGGGPETMTIVSSDLSHYHPHAEARETDRETVRQILRLEGWLAHEQACGATPANGLLVSARRHELRPTLLGMCTSGDTAGDRRRVVGYAAVSFARPGTD